MSPARKYQNDDATPREIGDLLRTHSTRPSEDVATFCDALVFNWLIGGTDGHAKNYSVLHGKGGRVRLAPLYDLGSALPYFRDAHRLKIAMKIGDHYWLNEIGRRDWEKLSGALALRSRDVLAHIDERAEPIPQIASSIADA